MRIKKINILYAGLFFLIFNHALAAGSAQEASTDPFIQVWKYFDGVNTYTLNITNSHAPGQDYYINYTFPGGSASTDMCQVSSNTSFTCMSGETVTRNDATHSVTLTTRNTSYVFYDPAHMPTPGKLLGNWSMVRSGGARFNISIMRGPGENDYNVITSYNDDRGNKCYIGVPDVYHASIHTDGSQILSYYRYSFKYDPKKNQIVNPNPGKDFHAGLCIQLMDDGDIAFTKN
ncbi:hypothetical protein E3983_00060 [Legionella israelensis]|uniref:Secreted protein n=1 Tax=Legionella israelensis TaxID=454 RepID=A0A0W0WG78_9GAMM|nr:hypothetical protein [Legionella israelensis]KTD31348.1 hypothetical protein Lisr_0659 [Legionella israelensis]QBR82891.1 hypothetical protein E3983_00060 [Legionella israelensis]QBS09833.1 hypothetical protein E4T55_08155 [Legionella israelensis]QDP71370.1 hypothetical protein FOG18_01630 [Legionella israelensis]SCY13660.1 hypothetical protein SAMN02746069_01409 [Legionella israelensis DSM 19235]